MGSQRQQSVLIVDDHDLTHSGLRLILNAGRFKVAGALKTGAEVLPFVESVQVDVVLLDLELPDLSGLSILAELVAVHDATVVVLSGSDDAMAYKTAMKLGARAVVSKRDVSASILSALESATDGAEYYSRYVETLISINETQSVVLSPRQMAILHFIDRGETNKEIGYRLRIAPPTVSFHLREIRQKLNVENNKKILQRAREIGLI